MRGTWLYGNAIRGRRCQRKTLLDTFLNPSFIDPFPDGRNVKAIGPLNVIHNTSDNTRAGAARVSGSRTPASPTPTPDECYPSTNIPLSTEGIRVGAFRSSNHDAVKVINDFLTGRLRYNSAVQRNRAVQVDCIESAFYDQGWRVDRAAIKQALEDLQQPGNTAFDSAAFNQDLPIRVDNHKGEEVEKLMAKVKGTTQGASDSEGESEDDVENDLFVRQTKKKRRTKSIHVKNYSRNIEMNLARIMAGRKAAAARNSVMLLDCRTSSEVLIHN
jgi:hypothetical protein